MFMRREIPDIFTKGDGRAVGDGLTHRIVAEVASDSFSERSPPLAPFRRGVGPMVQAGSSCLPQGGQRSRHVEQILLEAFLLRLMSWIRCSRHSQYLVDPVRMMDAGAGRIHGLSAEGRSGNERYQHPNERKSFGRNHALIVPAGGVPSGAASREWSRASVSHSRGNFMA